MGRTRTTNAIRAEFLVPGDHLKDRGKEVTVKEVTKTKKGIRFKTSEDKSYTLSPNRKIAVARFSW